MATFLKGFVLGEQRQKADRESEEIFDIWKGVSFQR